jgi:hypothetical protein
MLDKVIEAMRSIQTEGDRWVLSDALCALVPKGSDFHQIMDKANNEKVGAGFSATTLRLYRDCAQRFPQGKRVKNVGFSAHKEALRGQSAGEAQKMLEQLVQTQGGGSKVTVRAVKRALATKQGTQKPQTQPTKKPVQTSRSHAEIVRDLMSGGGDLIKAISPAMSESDLIKLAQGLNKVLLKVDDLRAKAQAKAQQATPAPAQPAAVPVNRGPVQPANGAGDLRDL